MAQTSISRRRPCRNCGSRYFASTMSIAAALIALAAAIGGIAKTVLGSKLFEGFDAGNVPDPAGFFGDITWLIGGFVVAIIVLVIGHGYRCIQCDTQQ